MFRSKKITHVRRDFLAEVQYADAASKIPNELVREQFKIVDERISAFLAKFEALENIKSEASKEQNCKTLKTAFVLPKATAKSFFKKYLLPDASHVLSRYLTTVDDELANKKSSPSYEVICQASTDFIVELTDLVCVKASNSLKSINNSLNYKAVDTDTVEEKDLVKSRCTIV